MKKSETTPGTLIANRYQVISVMGKGGMGTILEARDTLLNLDVAMKVMAIDHTGMNAARLQREAIACGNLRHSGIARIYEFGQTSEGSPYMVMELLVGLNLAQYLEEYDYLPYQAALPILRQIATALAFAHKNGVVHRDLKPSNIMLVEQMSGDFGVKLLDFGVAQTQQQSQTLTATGVMIGSPLYASPEQAQSEDLDYRTDIYSFGCLMYECLSGKPPFIGNSPIETLALHKKTKPALLSNVLPPKSIPVTLTELVDKCLQKERDKRPQSMQEIADILTSIENSNTDDLALNTTIVYSKRKWVLITLTGCLITSVCWLIYSHQTIKPVVVKAIKQNKMGKSPSTNWEALRNYRQGVNAETFRIIDRDGFKMAENTTEDITVEELKALAKEKLQGLRLIGFSSTNGITKYLNVKDIHVLQLDNSAIDNSCLKELIAMSNLRTLMIDSPSINDAGIPLINEFKSLESLRLNCPEISDTGISKLNLPNLKRISILSSNITGSGLNSLKQSPINHITLSCSGLKPDIGLTLGKFPKLKHLEFSGVNLSNESMRAISNLEPMSLKLKDTHLSSEDFDTLSKTISLSQLDLNETPVSEANLAKLSKLKNLYSLDLSGSREISNQMINIICSLKLSRLNLSHTLISDDQLRQLIKLKSLDHLILKNCEKLSLESVADFVRDFKNINQKPVTVKSSDLLESAT